MATAYVGWRSTCTCGVVGFFRKKNVFHRRPSPCPCGRDAWRHSKCLPKPEQYFCLGESSQRCLMSHAVQYSIILSSAVRDTAAARSPRGKTVPVFLLPRVASVNSYDKATSARVSGRYGITKRSWTVLCGIPPILVQITRSCREPTAYHMQRTRGSSVMRPSAPSMTSGVHASTPNPT